MYDICKTVFEFNILRKDTERRLSQFNFNSHCLQNPNIFHYISYFVQFWWVAPSFLSNSVFTQSCCQFCTHYRGHDNKLSSVADASLAHGYLENALLAHSTLLPCCWAAWFLVPSRRFLPNQWKAHVWQRVILIGDLSPIDQRDLLMNTAFPGPVRIFSLTLQSKYFLTHRQIIFKK